MRPNSGHGYRNRSRGDHFFGTAARDSGDVVVFGGAGGERDVVDACGCGERGARISGALGQCRIICGCGCEDRWWIKGGDGAFDFISGGSRVGGWRQAWWNCEVSRLILFS